MGALVVLINLVAFVAVLMLPVLLQARMPEPSHTEPRPCAGGSLINLVVAVLFLFYACWMFWGLLSGGPHG